MNIFALIILFILIYILLQKYMNKKEYFTNLLNFDVSNQENEDNIIEKTTIYLEEYDTNSFHPNFIISNNKKEGYLFIKDFWEMYNLFINIKDKNKKIISTITHYNSNIYKFNIDNIENKMKYINKDNKLFILNTIINKNIKEFIINKSNIIYNNENIGNIIKNGNIIEINILNKYTIYINSIAISYMIYIQLVKEKMQIYI